MSLIKNRIFGRTRDERGAFAVVYAILVLLLFGIAALGTDLGNGISRRTSVQGQADFAAYDAGQKLTASVRTGYAIPAAVVNQVRDSLNNNQPQNDGNSCDTTTPVTCVTSSMLTDGNLQNGEVRVTSLGLQVVAPRTHVDFGLAGFVDRSGADVTADATVNVFSPGRGVFPMFAVSGCDSGRQTLTDPANGHVSGGTPTLVLSGNGNTDLASLTIRDGVYAQQQTVPKDASNYSLWITANSWNSMQEIGFSMDGNTVSVRPNPVVLRSTATHAALTPIPVTSNTVVVEVPIPTAVTATEGVWYVTAFAGNNANNTRWSRADDALSFRVGQSLLECAAGSTSGNFGTLAIPRNDVTPSNEIPMNIAKGLQDPPNLTVHAWGQSQVSNVNWNGQCTNGQNLAVVSTGPNDRREDTNCVGTDPGLAANVATDGFVTGVKSGNTILAKGLLDAPTTCNATGGTTSRSVTIQSNTYSLNNDVLSCFLTGGKSLFDIANLNYAGPAALTPAVLKSPRFGFVPVVAKQPANGASNRYSIIDFRPAFITDEAATAAATKGSQTGTSDNGLTFSNNSLTTIKVIFFDIDALPRDGDIPLMDFLGVGKPIVHLVD